MELIEIKVNQNLMELTRHETADLPMQVYTDRYDQFIFKHVNWHWHNELEFIAGIKGQIKCMIHNEEITIDPEEGVFINSAVLHQMLPVTSPEETLALSICASPLLLASPDQGSLYTKYISPAITNTDFPYCVLSPYVSWQNEILQGLRTIYDLDKKRESGYELTYRFYMFKIWQLLVENTELCDNKNPLAERAYLKNQRINAMLSFIKKNYHLSITAEDIADAANISRSECFRAFSRMLGTKPIEFLINYRIEQTILQMQYTDKTITDIALSCGFNSTSYFSSVFLKRMGCSPSNYRKQL